ncbi:MAG: recombination mediator RecR [Chitinophagales bacterium]
MNFPSKLIEDAVKEFTKLPGIGKKTALRLVLHLLKEETKNVELFGQTVIKMRQDIQFCQKCHNVADQSVCSICLDLGRDHTTICVVENMRDVIAIENTHQYRGLYHVLGGVISPIDGIGPDNLNVDSLVDRVKKGDATEIIMALNPTMEGDTTIFYISKRLSDEKVRITSIARGIAFGGELEYVDELTLARSIATRLPYENYLINR